MATSFGKLYWRVTLSSILLAALSACGGGGGGGGTSISVSPRSLTFTVKTSELAAPQRVSVQYKGSGVVAGYAPGVAPPSWLNVTQAGAASDSQVTFDISVNQTGMSPGTHKTSLRFLTGIVPPGGDLEDARDITYTDLQVSLTIIRFSLFPTFLPVHLPEGGTTPLTDNLQLDLDPNMPWTASSNQPWLSIDKSSGTGRATIRYSVSPTGLSSGTYNGAVTVRDKAGRSEVFRVDLNIRPAYLVPEPNNLVFEITSDASAAARTQTLTISDELQGAVPGRAISWTARSTVPWLTLSRTSGTTSPPKDLVVTVPADVLATMANNQYTGHVLIDYSTSDLRPQSYSVLVQLRLNAPITAVSLTLPDAGRAVIAQGLPVNYRGFVTYSHGYQEERTQQLAWSSSSAAVASVGTDGPTAGVAQPLEPGETTIRATVPGAPLEASVTLAVQAASAVAYIVSTYGSEDIWQLVADESGHLQPMAEARVPAGSIPTGMVFTPDGKYAYVLNLGDGGSGQFGIAQFSVDRSGSLRPLTKPRALLGGNVPLKAMAVDAEGRHIYVSTSGSPGGVLRLDIAADGSLTMERTPPIPAGDYNISLTAHPSAPYLYSPDFHNDKIYQYAIGANGILTLLAEMPATGSLPNDIVMHPSGKYAYVVNFFERGLPVVGAISQYNVGPDGSLQPMTQPTVLDGKWGRRMTLSPDGKFAFLIFTIPDRNQNDGETGIATFTIAANGALIPAHNYRILHPGAMAVDPTSQILYLTTGFQNVLQFHIGSDATLLQDNNVLANPNGAGGLVVRKPSGAK